VVERKRLAVEGVGEQYVVGEREVEFEAGVESVRADDSGSERCRKVERVARSAARRRRVAPSRPIALRAGSR
jgi:hypothetical protein